MTLCDHNYCVILQTNRARCALYRKILDLLDEEIISGARSGRTSLYNLMRSPTMYIKVNRLLKYGSLFMCNSTVKFGISFTSCSENGNEIA